MNFIPNEKATTIRQPSTANLMIDSADRKKDASGNFIETPWDFQIIKNNSIMNGFFTRIGATEVVFEWCDDNVDTFTYPLIFDISGATVRSTENIYIIGSYTAEGFLTDLALDLTGINGVSFSISGNSNQGGVSLDASGGKFRVFPGVFATKLGISTTPTLTAQKGITCVDLRPYRYIDITSSQLTYNQDLKDNSTNTNARDVLVRWYFDDDVPEQLDGLGFPILMGYTRFCRRRIYNPPKQIKWNSEQPLGNISFQSFGDDGQLVNTNDPKTNWLMTLQFSEV